MTALKKEKWSTENLLELRRKHDDRTLLFIYENKLLMVVIGALNYDDSTKMPLCIKIDNRKD